MKHMIITVFYTVFYIARHRTMPEPSARRFAVSEQVSEPWANVLDNAWHWAEYVPGTPDDPAELPDWAIEGDFEFDDIII